MAESLKNLFNYYNKLKLWHFTKAGPPVEKSSTQTYIEPLLVQLCVKWNINFKNWKYIKLSPRIRFVLLKITW